MTQILPQLRSKEKIFLIIWEWKTLNEVLRIHCKPGLSYHARLHVTNPQRVTASLSRLNKGGIRKYYYLL